MTETTSSSFCGLRYTSEWSDLTLSCAHTHTHSFDHDGLGRYGDRLHPDGDLLAMQTVAAVLQDQGLLFLTVPVGQ